MPIPKKKLLKHLLTLKGGSVLHQDTLGKAGRGIGLTALGSLSFPLNPIQIRALIELANKAPFGKGRDTVVDEEVRNTWEIEAEQVDLSSPTLQKGMEKVLGRLAKEMNVTGEIEAVPYKLLVYESGGFFLEHQDSEKLPGMFGTLLLGLPSPHEGGELLIDPGSGEKITVSFAENDAANFPVVAFFADRRHEVLPVTEGYRVVLVFNLVQIDGGYPEMLDMEAAVVRMEVLLQKLRKEDPPLYLALGHQYTETNFCTSNLKGHDAVRVAVLRKAAARVGLEIRVGLIKRTGTSEWENAGQFGQGYGYYSRYEHDGYEFDGEEPKSFEQVVLGEVYDESLTIGSWLADDGPGVGALTLRENDILSPPDRRKEDPIDWSVEGYQGNWGMTASFTYSYAGILLWHPAITDHLVRQMSPADRIIWAKANSQDIGQKAIQNKLESLLIATAEETANLRTYQINFDEVLHLLIRLGRAAREKGLRVFLAWEEILLNQFQNLNPKIWPEVGSVFGNKVAENFLNKVFRRVKELSYGVKKKYLLVVLDSIREMLVVPDKDLQKIGNSLLSQLPMFLRDFYPSLRQEAGYLNALLALSNEKPENSLWHREEFQSVLLPRIDDPVWVRTTLGPILRDQPIDKGLLPKLRAAILPGLRLRASQPPTAYTDWARPLPKCMITPSGDYTDVLNFLQDPKKDTYKFQRPKAERERLSQYISNYQLDLEGTTLRTRPAHTLVLTKTNQSYYRHCQEFAQDTELLEALEQASLDTS